MPQVSQPAQNPNATPGPEGETPHEPSQPPTGYEPTPGPTVTVTGGVNVPVGPNQLRLDAQIWRVEFEESVAVLVTAEGNVKAIYQNYTVLSETARIDLKTKIATFSGNVIFQVDGLDVHGSELSINLDTRGWNFESAKSEIKPESFPELIKAPVFLSGSSVSGRSDNFAQAINGGFTTCNLEHPHYFISAKSIAVWPNEKLVARDATFIALGKRIFRIPLLSIPLTRLRERPSIMPSVGQTEEEGFFLKTAYTYAATVANSGNLKLDLMTEKGVGLGIDDLYTVKTGQGNLNLYQLSDKNRDLNTLTGRWTHQQKFGTITANLTSDYRANSYQYASQSTSLSNELHLSRNQPGASTDFGIRQSLNHGFGRYGTWTSTLQHNQQFGEQSSAVINFDYFRSESPFSINNETVNAATAQLVSGLDYSQRAKRYDWNLRINKINDLSDDILIKNLGSQFTGTEKLPELELTTSGERLGKTFFGLPTLLRLAVGKYSEDLGKVETERMVADIDVPSRKYKLSDQLNLAVGGGFRQYVYGDDTAQYSIDTTADLTRQIGKESSAALTYRFLRPRGFTPFRFDFIGKYNTLSARLNMRETQRFRFSLYTGYNFEQEDFPWQDISFKMAFAPNDQYLFYTSTGYDLNRSKWRSLINQVRVRLTDNFKLDVGSRYDIAESKLASIKAQIDTPFGSLWHIRANAGYNGYTSEFDYRNIQLVRDLHCWELSLTYVDQTSFWQQKGLMLNLRIKAFPLFDSFGVGQFGQALDTSVGEEL
ncbi:MAG: hypothetical protein ABFD64_03060 [Armatimonadota bacterium]